MGAGHAGVHVREPVGSGHAGDDAGGAAGHHPGEGVRRPGEEEPVRGAPPGCDGAGVRVHPRRAVRVGPRPAGVVRQGAGVEGARRRQRRRALHLLHVRQLVLRLVDVGPTTLRGGEMAHIVGM